MAKKEDFTSNVKTNPRTVNVEEEEKPKKKVGRPKSKPEGNYKTINIAVHEDKMPKIEIAKLKHGNNLTQYINDLIDQDLATNYEKYVEFEKLYNG